MSSLLWARPLWRLVSPATNVLPSSLRGALPSGGWRIYTVTPGLPRFDPSSWRLHVDGLVTQPLTLGYQEVRGLPRVEQTSDFHCVTGWSVSNVRWTGVRLHDVLAAAAPSADAKAIEFGSADGAYVDGLTLGQASLADVMLAYEMDGEPLSRAHGAPLRLVIPEMYGYKNVKWVNRITLSKGLSPGYWELRGYDVDAWVGRSNGYGA